VDRTSAIVAVVGEKTMRAALRASPDAKFRAMGRENVNIMPIAQGLPGEQYFLCLEKRARVKKGVLASPRMWACTCLPTEN